MTIVKRHILLAICLMAAVLTCKGQGYMRSLPPVTELNMYLEEVER